MVTWYVMLEVFLIALEDLAAVETGNLLVSLHACLLVLMVPNLSVFKALLYSKVMHIEKVLKQ